MSDTPFAYFDENRDAVILRLESGTEIAVMHTDEAESLGRELLAAARGEDTGYEEFLAQERGEDTTSVEVFQDPVTGSYWRTDGQPGYACPDCGNGYATESTANDPDAHGCEAAGDDSDDDGTAVYGQNDAYPHGRCQACGFGLAENRACVNTDCSRYDRDADPNPPICVLTGAEGESEDDCTTHDHDRDAPDDHGTWEDGFHTATVSGPITVVRDTDDRPDTDEGTLVARATDDPAYDEAAAQEQQRPGGEAMYGVYARFIQPVGPEQGQFDAIEAVDALVAGLDGVDAVWNEGTARSNWMPEEQAQVADPAKTYLIIVRFVEVATDGDAAAEAVRARLAAKNLDVDEVFTAAEYEG